MKIKILTTWGKIECSETDAKWSRNALFLHIKTNTINLTFPQEYIKEIIEYELMELVTK
ncbi:MAG: hypothetical protein MUO31_00880 [Thermodesulfovibrionales bacterium]|nr:hypothetical protein [Thermodesulfovibrionales bacterium]